MKFKNKIDVKTFLAFAAIYIIWGSTYLAIRYGVETFPPFIMASTRFLIAGGILFTIEIYRTKKLPTFKQWKDAFIVGFLMLFFGNGLVTWAEKTVPSGLAALLVTSTPIWMLIFDWMSPKGMKPKAWVFIGIVLGILGMIILINPTNLKDEAHVPIWGVLAVLFADIAWAAGSIYSRHADLPKSPFMTTSIQMLGGGVLLFLLSLSSGEYFSFSISQISMKSFLSMLYLAGAGSLIAFSAYIWLLQKYPPTLVSTSAFVNPIIAVFVGWLAADEIITPRIFVAASVIVLAVTIITIGNLTKDKGNKTILSPGDCEPIEDGIVKKD